MKKLTDRNKKRLTKAIKKLFVKYAIKTLGIEYNRIYLEIGYGKFEGGSYFDFVDKCIFLGYFNLCNKTKTGYDDDYYEGRKAKLSFVIGNKRKAFLFVLLHELYHAKQRILQRKDSSYPREKRECEADNYAIEVIKNELI